MSIKTCPSCGWEYPSSYNQKTCRFCGESMATNYKCCLCQSDLDTTAAAKFGEWWCRSCARDLVILYEMHLADSAENFFGRWKKLLAEQLRDPMSPSDWNATVAYFNGCAFCGDPVVTTRIPFVDMTDGGYYAEWNILPVCDSCATFRKKYRNPFKCFRYADYKRFREQNEDIPEEAGSRVVKFMLSRMVGDKHEWEFEGSPLDYLRQLRKVISDVEQVYGAPSISYNSRQRPSAGS